MKSEVKEVEKIGRESDFSDVQLVTFVNEENTNTFVVLTTGVQDRSAFSGVVVHNSSGTGHSVGTFNSSWSKDCFKLLPQQIEVTLKN